MLTINQMKNSNVIGIKADHVVKKEDYKKLDSIVERKANIYGSLRMIVNIGELDGILLSAFWEDLKISVNHPKDFEKVAIVGSNNVKKIIIKTIAPLVNSEIRCFEKKLKAQQWIFNS